MVASVVIVVAGRYWYKWKKRAANYYYYYYYYYYDFTVHKTKENIAIKYEIVTECTEGTPVGGAGALGMDRALQRTNNIK